MADPGELARLLSEQYDIERELGQGGMATVWLARDVKHHRRVALKVLKPELAAALGRERFLHEIRLTAQLQHPHILPLLDSGDAGGQLWYAMPFVEGETLRQRLQREGPLDVEQVRHLVREIGGALAYAHGHGVIHRDIKPENILLSEGGALVADFGIARAVDATADQRMTNTGLAVGTPAYMSPEQALGQRNLDGRSDLYAFASVVYEMLAGGPPFAASSPQALIAQRFTQPAPPVQATRPDTPALVADAVAKALAREPGERHSTVSEFVHAFEVTPAATTTRIATRPSRRGRWLVAALCAVAAVFVVWTRFRPPVAIALEPDLVAVAPFDIRAPGLESWSEGMVDVLSRYFDGAGPLRTVSAARVLRGWEGRADRESAGALGKRLGAGVVVFGDVTRESDDSVRLRATVLDVRGAQAEEVEVRGEAGRFGQLTDSLGRAVLAALARTRPIGVVTGSALGGKSLPALKTFLAAEQLFRRGQHDSAIARYQQALDLDSTLALAYVRMALASWYSLRSNEGNTYLQRAIAGMSSLPPRDSLLVTSIACLQGLDTSWKAGVQGSHARHRCAREAAREAIARYPSDPEPWYMLGEVFTHMGREAGAANADALNAFRRAIELDSAFLPAYEHAAQQAAAAGLMDQGLQLTRAAALRFRGTPRGPQFAMADRLLLPAHGDGMRTDSLLATMSSYELWNVISYVHLFDDSSESAVRVARALVGLRAHDPNTGWWADTLQQQRTLANELARRGHAREAVEIVKALPPGGFQSPYVSLALVGAISPEEADSAMRAWAKAKPNAWWWNNVNKAGDMLIWARARSDTAAIEAAKRMVESSNPEAAPMFARIAGAYGLLARSDSAGALRALEAIPDSACLGDANCAPPRILQAQLLAWSGRPAEAARLYDNWMNYINGALVPMALLERGRLAEELNDPETAQRHYERVLGFWRNADPLYQPWVREAREGLARVVAEPQRAPAP